MKLKNLFPLDQDLINLRNYLGIRTFKYLPKIMVIDWKKLITTAMLKSLVNLFVPYALFLYSLKTSENLTVFWSFPGVDKGCIGSKWINLNLLLPSLRYKIRLPFFMGFLLLTPTFRKTEEAGGDYFQFLSNTSIHLTNINSPYS